MNDNEDTKRRAIREATAITRDRLLFEGPWRTIGDRGAVTAFVRPGVSVSIYFDFRTGGTTATVGEMSTGAMSPKVHLMTMADVDDLVRLYHVPEPPPLDLTGLPEGFDSEAGKDVAP